jgi:hypothetical protein
VTEPAEATPFLSRNSKTSRSFPSFLATRETEKKGATWTNQRATIFSFVCNRV